MTWETVRQATVSAVVDDEELEVFLALQQNGDEYRVIIDGEQTGTSLKVSREFADALFTWYLSVVRGDMEEYLRYELGRDDVPQEMQN